jgi:predicted nucleic acid-binding protein
MIRVVIDTNVLVSGLLTSGGLPEAVINLAISGEVRWFASPSVLAEYEEVLKRPGLAIDSRKAADAMARIRALFLWSHRLYASQRQATLTITSSSMRRDLASALPRYRESSPFPRGLERDSHCDASRVHRCLDIGFGRIALTDNGS